jgi:hypothetical protein
VVCFCGSNRVMVNPVYPLALAILGFQFIGASPTIAQELIATELTPETTDQLSLEGIQSISEDLQDSSPSPSNPVSKRAFDLGDEQSPFEGAKLAQVTAEIFPPETSTTELAPEPDLEATVIDSDNIEDLADSTIAGASIDAQELLDRMADPDYPNDPLLSQVIPLQRLVDVRPTDWAYQALRSLVERYGCVAGYPDATFRGNQAITRYEAAALVNACLDTVNDLIAKATADLATQNDLAVLQRLQTEFADELATLKERVGVLEEQVAELQNNRFAKRTKLIGIGEFIMADVFGNDTTVNTTVSGNVSLDIDARFKPQDLLRVGLVVSNINSLAAASTGTDMTRLDFVPSTTDDGSPATIFPDVGSGEPVLDLTALYYQTRFAGKGLLRFGPTGIIANQMIPDLSPVRANSRFGRRSNIYRLSNGAGAMVLYPVNDWFSVSGAYTVAPRNANDLGLGVFGGQNTIFTQATFTPNEKLGLAVSYARFYSAGTPASAATGRNASPVSVTGFTGSTFAQAPFGVLRATSANVFSLQGSYRLTEKITLGGWAGYTQAIAEASGPLAGFSRVVEGDTADIWNWALALSVQDIWKKGGQLGFVFGMPPKLTRSDVAGREDKDTSYHAEAYYSYPLTPRITVSPGVFAIFNPEHDNTNDTILVGVIRSIFRF